MNDRVVLALDGSTSVCTVGLVGLREYRWEVVAERCENDGRSQVRTLLGFVDEMLDEVGMVPSDLSAVVVGTGPGTFTGIRVAVATARALGLSLRIPVLGISTLATLAAGAIGISLGGLRPGLLLPVVDARRGQVFYGAYRSVTVATSALGGLWMRTDAFHVCDRGTLGDVVAEELGRQIDLGDVNRDARAGLAPVTAVVVGEQALCPIGLPSGAIYATADVAAKHLLIGQESLHEPGFLPEGRRALDWLAEAFVVGWGRDGTTPDPGAAGTPESVKPLYVRSPDADIHIKKMRDPWSGVGGDR